MPESSNKGGRKPRVTDEDLLDVFRSTSDPVLSTAEVADAVSIKRRGTLNRLRDLEDARTLDSKQIGGRNTVWWLAVEGDGFETADLRGDPGTALDDDQTQDLDMRESHGTAPASETPQSLAVNTDDESDDMPAALIDDVRAYLEDNDQPPKTALGRSAVLDVFQLLREHGTMSTGNLKDKIYPDYIEHWGSKRTMWNAIDRYLADIPGIEKVDYGKWGYTDDESVRGAISDDQANPLDGSGPYDPSEEF